MSPTLGSSRVPTDGSASACSSQVQQLHSSSTFSAVDMKDISAVSNKAARLAIYPKSRHSPYGVSKFRKASPLCPPQDPVRKTPRATRADLIAQRQRDLRIMVLRREGVFMEDEYGEEIKSYMHETERSTRSSLEQMDQQPEIRWHMRPCLVDFLVEIHFSFRLRPETLYLTLNIIDRYVSRRVVYVKHYQLVGCAALWIAAKFEDTKERVPTVQDLAHMCGDTYAECAFIQMEGHVLSTIQWALGHPTAEVWMRLLCCETYIEELKVQHVARFLMEITLFYREFVKYLPSAIALGSLTLARFLCGKDCRMLEQTEESLEIVDLLDNRLAQHVNDLSETLVKKYSYAFYSKAATFVIQYYLQGGRFENHSLLVLPVTPVRATSPKINTPMSVSTTASDLSDDMPATPTSPTFPSDMFSGPLTSDDKENLPSPIFEPVINKAQVESTPDQFLPHEFVTISRPALHSLNAPSPRAVVAS